MAALAVAGACPAAALPPDLGANLLQNYIHPAMREFRDSASGLRAAMAVHCAVPTESASGPVARGFASVVHAWSHIEFLRFGPLLEENRYERINFWPDPRGIVLRQAQGMLNGTREIPDSGELATQSVALQGLPALEYVLYRERGLLSEEAEGKGRACKYAEAITGNLVAMGEELVAAWRADSRFGRQFVHPSAGHAIYRNQREVASEAFKALSTGLQFADTVKLEPVLGQEAASAKPQRAPFWRSGLAAGSQKAGIDGLYRFYLAGDYEYGRDEQWMDQSVRGELRRAAEGFDAFPSPWDAGVHSEEGRRWLRLTSLVLKNAKNVIDEHVAPAFGVRIGFNALDGD